MSDSLDNAIWYTKPSLILIVQLLSVRMIDSFLNP